MGGGPVNGMGNGVRCGRRWARTIIEGARGAAVAAVGVMVLAWTGPAAGQALGGSAASLDRQNAQARAHDFTYLRSPDDVRRFVELGYLVRVVPNRDFELHDVSYPYARPEARLFIERLAAQYRSACGEKLVVTSLTRPLSNQPVNASDRSVHPTGMAIDFRRSNRSACRSWLESTTLTLEGRGVLEVTRERRPPHYHVVIYPDPYRAYVSRITGGQVRLASEPSAAPAEERVTHVVRRGESLSRIASDYGVGVSRIRAENGLRGDRILTGQRLQIPVARAVSVAASVADGPVEPPPVAPEPVVAAAETEVMIPEQTPDIGRTHLVRRGESLWTIARDYGIDEVSLRRVNTITGSRIYAGQELSIPSGPGEGTRASLEHIVRSGESLWTIAGAYRTSMDEIRAANGVRGSRLLVGQTLTIPGGAGGSAVMAHTVRRGESLWTIANRHGTTVEDLRRANGIGSSRIYPGQTLNVPTDS